MKNKILAIQADDLKYKLLYQQLSTLGYPDAATVRCFSTAESKSIPADNISIILIALPEGNNDRLETLRTLNEHFADTPVIVLSDTYDTDIYLNGINDCLQDVLVTGDYNTAQLGNAIQFAIARKAQLLNFKYAFAEYKKHFDNGPIPMCIVDEESLQFLLVNNAAVVKYGYSKEEFYKLSIRDIRPPEDVSAMLNSIKDQGDAYFDAGIWRHLKKNGEIFHVHIYSHSTVFNGRAARLSFVVDVDEQLQIKKQNKELTTLSIDQKEQLDDILLSISDAVWSGNAETLDAIYINDACYNIFGYTAEEMKADKNLFVQSIHPDDYEQYLEAIKAVKITGKKDVVYRYILKNGIVKTLRSQIIFKKGYNGKPDLLNGITIDITRERKLMDAIRTSEHKLRATINNTQDLIWSVDRNLNIIFCNKAFHDFFVLIVGVDLHEGDYILGDWHSESFISKRQKDYERAFNGESFLTTIEENRTGEILYFEISSSPIRDHDGTIIGVNCILRDVTEQKRQLIKIKKQNDRLKEIAWIQSHRVRGPVANILGLVSLFEEEVAGNEHNLDVLQKLKIAANTLDDVIKSIVAGTNDADTDSPLNI